MQWAANVLLQQGVEAKVVGWLLVLVVEQQAVVQVVVRRVRWEISVVVHRDVGVREVDQVEVGHLRVANAHVNRAGAVGILQPLLGGLDRGVELQNVTQQERPRDAGDRVLALVVCPHLLADADLGGAVARDGTHHTGPGQDGEGVALVGRVVHDDHRELLEGAVGGPIKSTKLNQGAVT